VSGPHKGSGGGAILMGQGFMGPYGPAWFSLTGLLGYPYGASFPSSGDAFKTQWFYKTESSPNYPAGLYRYINQGTEQNPNYQWILKVQCDRFGSYPSGTTLPNTGDKEQYFYKTNTKDLFQYSESINTPNVREWIKRFSHVQSPNYDTLFMVKGFADPATGFQNLSNIHLGGLTATKAVYTDQIKHLDGSNWSFSGGGGNSSMRAGQGTTDSDGTKTIAFPAGTFTASPIVTVTVVDTSNNSQAYTAKIVSATKDGFKVKILTSRHKHLLGNTGNRITSNLYKIPGITPSDAAASIYEYPLAFYNNIENNTVVGAVITNSTGPSTGQDFYSLTENGANTVGSGIVFNWIAVPQNQ